MQLLLISTTPNNIMMLALLDTLVTYNFRQVGSLRCGMQRLETGYRGHHRNL